MNEATFLSEVNGTARSKFNVFDVPNPANGPWIVVMRATGLAYTKVTIIDREPTAYLADEQARFPLKLMIVASYAIDPVRATYWHGRLREALAVYRTETASTWYSFSEAMLLSVVNGLDAEVPADNTNVARVRSRYQTPEQELPVAATFCGNGISLLERAIGWLAAGDYDSFAVYRDIEKVAFWEGYSHFKLIKETQPEAWFAIRACFFDNPAYIDWQIRAGIIKPTPQQLRRVHAQ